jgi:hypothetical protein
MVGMTAGFEAVPEELRSSARSIASALAEATGLSWRKPRGDYGHPGVQSAFAAFVEDAERRVATLAETAARLGRGLDESAGAYEGSDSGAAESLERLIEGLGSGSAGSGSGGMVAGGTGAEPSELWKKLNPTAAEGR